jgi:hypothetical protein
MMMMMMMMILDDDDDLHLFQRAIAYSHATQLLITASHSQIYHDENDKNRLILDIMLHIILPVDLFAKYVILCILSQYVKMRFLHIVIDFCMAIF